LANEKMKVDALESIYSEIKNSGKRVMAVVANACATSTGLYDNLMAIGDFCQKHGLWYHVDGAHGAAALLSPIHRSKLDGITQADSMIWDAHKMMRVPALCTAVLFRDFTHQAQAFQQKGSYVFHDTEVVGMDSMPYTIECTKSALGTKLFWTFALEGEKNIEHFIDQSIALAQEFHGLLKESPDFEVPYFPQSNILCFRYTAGPQDDEFQKKLRYAIINAHQFYITSCEFAGKRYLRVVLMHPKSTVSHLRQLIETVRNTAKSLSE